MQLTAESRESRWQILIATWVLCAALVILHTFAVSDYLKLLGSRGLRGAHDAATPLRQVVPAGYADAQMWIRHAIDGQAAYDRTSGVAAQAVAANFTPGRCRTSIAARHPGCTRTLGKPTGHGA
jgi:hypothetical protein